MFLSILTATHYRADTLRSKAFPSVCQQSDLDFEWVVVNDGADPETRAVCHDLLDPLTVLFPCQYLEMAHPTTGFGLCHARNLGLAAATGEWVVYLDDDNALAPEFVAATKHWLQTHPNVQYSLVQQRRRRDVVQAGRVQRQGQPFVAPAPGTALTDLVQQRALFDSNGFTHRRAQAPVWNPDYRVFADYAYLLQCMAQWGRPAFSLQAAVLVEYVQRSDGVIGQSSYQDWSAELQTLLHGASPAFTTAERAALEARLKQWQAAAQAAKPVPAFVV